HDHFSSFPSNLESTGAQIAVVEKLKLFRLGQLPGGVGFDLFIGFPSMHVAQPWIAMAFIRRQGWKGMWYALLIYNLCLTLTILLLYGYYLSEFGAGSLCAILAVFIARLPLQMWNGLRIKAETPTYSPQAE